MGKVDEALDGFDLRILPKAHVFGCDATFRRNGSRFDTGQAGAALDYAAHMCEVPVCVVAIWCRVLAKRRKHDPVLEGDAANLERMEDFGNRGNILAFFHDRSACGWVL